MEDPDEECHNTKHVDQAVYFYLLINLHQLPSKLQSSSWVYKYQLYFYYVEFYHYGVQNKEGRRRLASLYFVVGPLSIYLALKWRRLSENVQWQP